MTKINPRTKGAKGELEFCRWLYDNLNIPMPTRNLEQVRSGGSDIIDVYPFYFEVKRCEKLALYSWWLQVKRAVDKASDEKLIPVVAFRQSRKAWQFMLPATLIKAGQGYILVSETTFLAWLNKQIKKGRIELS